MDAQGASAPLWRRRRLSLLVRRQLLAWRVPTHGVLGLGVVKGNCNTLITDTNRFLCVHVVEVYALTTAHRCNLPKFYRVAPADMDARDDARVETDCDVDCVVESRIS